MLPDIPVPEKYDVINSSFLLTEYASAKTAGLSSIILSELQKELAQKKFYANPDVAAFVQTVMDLDPFPDKTIDEKDAMVSAGTAVKEDVILSNYITDLVKQALEEDKNFNSKTSAQKRQVLEKLASAKAAKLSASSAIQQDLLSSNMAPAKEETISVSA